jgi:hypothetical protein
MNVAVSMLVRVIVCVPSVVVAVIVRVRVSVSDFVKIRVLARQLAQNGLINESHLSSEFDVAFIDALSRLIYHDLISGRYCE